MVAAIWLAFAYFVIVVFGVLFSSVGSYLIARVALRNRGIWYVKFINMRAISAAAGDSVDYESKWATMTFAVR